MDISRSKYDNDLSLAHIIDALRGDRVEDVLDVAHEAAYRLRLLHEWASDPITPAKERGNTPFYGDAQMDALERLLSREVDPAKWCDGKYEQVLGVVPR